MRPDENCDHSTADVPINVVFDEKVMETENKPTHTATCTYCANRFEVDLSNPAPGKLSDPKTGKLKAVLIRCEK